MTLSWEVWRGETRIQRAELNNPSMKPGEKGLPVHLLQAALILNGFDVPHHGFTPDRAGKGDSIGGETQAAIRRCESVFRLTTRDTGVAGAEVIGRLDRESDAFYKLHAGHFGAALARQDASLALGKVGSALLALTFLRAGQLPAIIAPLVNDALRVHFRLLPPGSAAAGPRRARTAADIDRIINTFTALSDVLVKSATTFEDGIPVNGIKTPAESNTGSRIVRFGPFYRDFDGPLGALIGPHSRAAIVIHEGTHAVDTSAPSPNALGRSGQADVHISEFDPAYDQQTADRSVLNPSSYASFAAHIANNGDPVPRFGLGVNGRAR